MNKLLIVLLLLVNFASLKAQPSYQEQKFLQRLRSETVDSVKLRLLSKYVEEEANDEIWPKYNDSLLAIAVSWLKKPLSNAEKKLYLKYKADALHNRGYLFDQQGRVSKALESYSQSLKICETIQDKAGIASSLNNIGYIHKHNNDVPKALDYFNRSLSIRQELKDYNGIATCLNNIGSLYQQQKDYNKALAYYQQSLAKQEEAIKKDTQSEMDYEGVAFTHISIGLLEEKKNEYRLALDYYLKAREMLEKIGDKQGLSVVYNTIAKLYLNEKNTQLYNVAIAKEYATKSIKFAHQLGFPEEIRNAARTLRDIYKKEGNYKLAVDMYDLYIKMRDSISNESFRKAAIQQSIQYAYDKKATADSVKNAEAKKVMDATIKAQDLALEKDRIQKYAMFGFLAIVIAFLVVVYNRFRITQKQKQIIERQNEEVILQRNTAESLRLEAERQKELVEEKQKEIVDSIHYASRIQKAMLTSREFFNRYLADKYFIFYQPKDIVSGDFYWAQEKEGKFYLVTADCTGHGVPGAFMSLLNMNFLNNHISEKGLRETDQILNEQRSEIINAINPTGKENSRDGMDCVLSCLDFKTQTLSFSGANNPVWVIRKNEEHHYQLLEFKTDKMPVGLSGMEHIPFAKQTIQLLPGDTIYTFTDGYADQFGGSKGKKFMYKPLKQLLISIQDRSMVDQHQIVKSTLQDWKGDLEQVDDVLLIGIKI